MSASTTFANSLIKAILHNLAIAGISLPAAAAGNLFARLHTGDPGAAGTQATNETAYPGYAGQPIIRSVAGWDVVDNTFDNVADVVFPESTGAATTITHFSIGTALSGAGVLLLRGKLATPVPIAAGTEPRFKAGMMTGAVDTSAPA